jgi:hypothetical protein
MAQTNWKDRNVQYPTRYTVTKVGGGAISSGDNVTMTAAPGTITEAGTGITAARMNDIEQRVDTTRRNSINIHMGGWRIG